MSRLKREWKTLKIMTKMYCHNFHAKIGLCSECIEFLSYAEKRLEHCRFGEEKPTCNKCPIHCYKQEMRDIAKKIMRFSGPRMIKRHPYLAFMHFVDRWMSKKVSC